MRLDLAQNDRKQQVVELSYDVQKKKDGKHKT